MIEGIPRPPSQQYDRIRRLLYSHPEMVADLLRGFFAAPWVEELDFSTLERVGEGFVSERLDARWSDLVWKVRWRGQDLYICLMMR